MNSFLFQTSASGTARWRSKWRLRAVRLERTPLCCGERTAAALCSQGSYKLVLTSSVLICSDIHWSQPGEKRMTGGTNWQPKAAPSTTWNPVSMVTRTHTHTLLTVVLVISASCLILLTFNEEVGLLWRSLACLCLFSHRQSWPSLPPHQQAWWDTAWSVQLQIYSRCCRV